jgi:hypothetical protein
MTHITKTSSVGSVNKYMKKKRGNSPTNSVTSRARTSAQSAKRKMTAVINAFLNAAKELEKKPKK